MRELKFRAWDRHEHVMFSASELVGEEFSVDPIGEGILDNGKSECLPWLIPLQWTGLKDRDGVEIYEGDILLIADEYTERILEDGTGPREEGNHLAPVGFEKGCYGVTISEEGDIFYKGFWSFERIEMEDDWPGTVKVVGNIYENSELVQEEP